MTIWVFRSFLLELAGIIEGHHGIGGGSFALLESVAYFPLVLE